MKKMILKALFLVLSALFMLHNAGFAQTIPEHFFVSNLKNNPLPKYPDTLRILGIGNSFTVDTMSYLPELLAVMEINNVTLGQMSIGGCSLERHYNLYMRDTLAYAYNKSIAGENVWSKPVSTSFKQGVANENWDIIVIQQVLHHADMYETYQSYLNDLIDIIRMHCTNAGVTLGWQMTWAYGGNSNHGGFANHHNNQMDYHNNQMEMYQTIVNAVKAMVVMTGIDLVIPSATAIQNLRGTSVNNPLLDLTRDGYHSDLGAGRYTLACTWFQSLITPCLGITIVGNPFKTDNGNAQVTEDNFLICQKAAQYVCSRRFGGLHYIDVLPTGRIRYLLKFDPEVTL